MLRDQFGDAQPTAPLAFRASHVEHRQPAGEIAERDRAAVARLRLFADAAIMPRSTTGGRFLEGCTLEILIIAILLGLVPATVAMSKGRNFFGWWIYGAALFIVALPHALVMKSDRGALEQKQLASGDTQKCPYCAELIKSQAKVCRFCQRDLPVSGSAA